MLGERPHTTTVHSTNASHVISTASDKVDTAAPPLEAICHSSVVSDYVPDWCKAIQYLSDTTGSTRIPYQQQAVLGTGTSPPNRAEAKCQTYWCCVKPMQVASHSSSFTPLSQIYQWKKLNPKRGGKCWVLQRARFSGLGGLRKLRVQRTLHQWSYQWFGALTSN